MGDIIIRLDGLNGVVQDLLVFARPRELRTEPVDLTNLMGQTIDLLRRDPIFAAVETRVEGSPPPRKQTPPNFNWWCKTC